MKGLIALDIDGTLTDNLKPTPAEVAAYLRFLSAEGWEMAFITGRTFHWGYTALKQLNFPYHFAFLSDILPAKCWLRLKVAAVL